MAGQKTATTVKTEYTPGQGQVYPLVSTTSSPSAAPIYTTTQQQVGAVFSGTLNLVFAASNAGSVATATGSVALSTFPAKIQLVGAQKGSIFVGITLAALETNLFLGMPYVRLAFGSGAPLLSTGGNTFALQTGRAYANPSLVVSVQAYAIATYTKPLTVPVLVGAVLYGSPA